MASWFGGLSSSLGSCLGQMSHSVVSLTRHISRCTKDVSMLEYKTEESNEIRRKEVETTKESVRSKVETCMTFYSDLDLENKQETAAYSNLLIKGNLDIKLFTGKEILEKQKLENLQEDTELVNAAADVVQATSSASVGANIDPKASEYKHELEQTSPEVTILRERHEAMKRKFIKLQKATISINGTTSLISSTPASISLGDNIDKNASEYEHLLKKQNLEMKILRRKNVAMKRKLLKLQKATECLNAAAGLLPAVSSTSPGENINPIASEYQHELKKKNLEVKILRGRNVAMKHKLFNLQKATQSPNVEAGLEPATPGSSSMAENIDLKTSEYKHQLEKQNLEMKILRGRNVAMKHKLLKLQKATQCQNMAAGLIPAMSSGSLGENVDPNASECKHGLKQKNLKVKILREEHRAMNHKLLKLENDTESTNTAAGLIPAISPSFSLGDDIDHNASEYENQFKQENLKMKILRGRNGAVKHEPLKLQKATECLNVASVLVAGSSSALLGENINPSASEYEHDLKQKNCEVKILRERYGAMKRKLLKLQKATESIKRTTSLIPAMPASVSQGDNISHHASEYEHLLKKQNLEMKILRGRNVAMKHKLLKLQKATEHLNAAAGLLPATSSTSLGENIDPIASEYQHELEKKTLEVKILRGRNVAMKYKLLNLQKATQSLNVEAGLEAVTPASTSLAENIDHKTSEKKTQLEKQNLEMKILRGRNVAMKHKLLKLLKATQCLNEAAGLVPAMSSASLGENIDPNASECKQGLKQENLKVEILREGHRAMNHTLLKLENDIESINTAAGLISATSPLSSLGDNIDHSASEYEHQFEQQNLKMKILRGRNVAIKRKLLKLQKATECVNVAAGLLPAMTSASLGENINPIASEYQHELEKKTLEVKILRGRNVAMKYKLFNLQKTSQCLNAEAHFVPIMPVWTSLGDNIDHNASEYENQLKQDNLEMKILRGRNVAMKHKLLKLRKATERLNAAAGLLPAMSSASLGENIDPNASEYKHELERKNLEMKTLKEKHKAMKRRLFKLQKATESTNVAGGLLPTTSSTSLGENINLSAFECKHHVEQNNLKMKIPRERHGAMKHKILNVEIATESRNTEAGLIPATSPSTSQGDNIDHSATECEYVLKQENLKMKILRGRNGAVKHEPLKLQKATECLNVASVLVAGSSTALLGENINPSASEYEHDLKQKNCEVKILRERYGAMKRKLLKLQKATESINTTTSLIPAMPASVSQGDNITHHASEYEHLLKKQNLEMKILRGRNVAMKRKLLKLQKATEHLNAAAGLLPATSSTSLGENIDPIASEYQHELEKKTLEVKILRGRNVAMKYKLLNLQKATQSLNVEAGLEAVTPASTSLAENIDHKTSEYKHHLEQQNLEVKILRGRNVAMKHKLLKLLKATQCLNEAAGLLPATSSASLGENIDPNASECKHGLLKVKIMREGHRAMNHTLLKLENAAESMNTTISLIPAMTASISRGDNINHNASEYDHQLKKQNLEMKILRGRNVAMKRKLLKLQKATEHLNAAAGLLPATSSTSLGENIDPIASEYQHELEKKTLEVKILRGRNVAMKYKLLNLQKATQSLNVEAGLEPATPGSSSMAENIDHKTSEEKTQLEQQNLEMKILRGRNVAMKHKLLKLLKATQCLNEAAGLIPAMSSTSLGENIDPNVSKNKHQLIEKNLEIKVLRERHAAMKHKLLKLQKATESTNTAVALIPAMPASTSLGDNVDPNAFDHHQLELENISRHASSIYQHLPGPSDLVDLIKSIFSIF